MHVMASGTSGMIAYTQAPSIIQELGPNRPNSWMIALNESRHRTRQLRALGRNPIE